MSPCRSDYIFTDEKVSVWHVVSEDSDHLSAWLAVIHCLRDFDDFEQITYREMRARLNHSQALYKLQEIQTFRSSQRVPLEEGNNRPKKITPFRNNELIQVFFVVVESMIAVDATYTEKLLHHVDTFDAFCALRHYKLMRHLESSFVTSAICSLRLSHDVDRKASLTVNETSNPTNLNQSFLLIVRS